VPDIIEQFAREHEIESGLVFYVGGAGSGSRLVVGLRRVRRTNHPIIHALSGIQEISAWAPFFPMKPGNPCCTCTPPSVGGRRHVGCTRAGVDVWLVGEVMILEILGTTAQRRRDPDSKLELLAIT